MQWLTDLFEQFAHSMLSLGLLLPHSECSRSNRLKYVMVRKFTQSRTEETKKARIRANNAYVATISVFPSFLLTTLNWKVHWIFMPFLEVGTILTNHAQSIICKVFTDLTLLLLESYVLSVGHGFVFLWGYTFVTNMHSLSDHCLNLIQGSTSHLFSLLRSINAP
jgi:hypothetical protein